MFVGKWYTSKTGAQKSVLQRNVLIFTSSKLRIRHGTSSHARGGWSHPTAIKIQLFLPRPHLLRHATSTLQGPLCNDIWEDNRLHWQYGWKLDDNLNLSMECNAWLSLALCCSMQCWAPLIWPSLISVVRPSHWWSVCVWGRAMIWQSHVPPNSSPQLKITPTCQNSHYRLNLPIFSNL